MARRPRPSPDAATRANMRLLMAAAAVFVLLAGLTLFTFLILRTGTKPSDATIAFGPFFLVGLVLFSASAFINSETIKAFLSVIKPVRHGTE